MFHENKPTGSKINGGREQIHMDKIIPKNLIFLIK
jgi:hypothetical protein